MAHILAACVFDLGWWRTTGATTMAILRFEALGNVTWAVRNALVYGVALAVLAARARRIPAVALFVPLVAVAYLGFVGNSLWISLQDRGPSGLLVPSAGSVSVGLFTSAFRDGVALARIPAYVAWGLGFTVAARGRERWFEGLALVAPDAVWTTIAADPSERAIYGAAHGTRLLVLAILVPLFERAVPLAFERLGIHVRPTPGDEAAGDA